MFTCFKLKRSGRKQRKITFEKQKKWDRSERPNKIVYLYCIIFLTVNFTFQRSVTMF